MIAMRSDFYSEWPRDEESVNLLTAGHFAVGLPGPAALEKMIVEPAKAAGLAIPHRLVQRILADAGTPPAPIARAVRAFAIVEKSGRHAERSGLQSDRPRVRCDRSSGGKGA